MLCLLLFVYLVRSTKLYISCVMLWIRIQHQPPNHQPQTNLNKCLILSYFANIVDNIIVHPRTNNCLMRKMHHLMETITLESLFIALRNDSQIHVYISCDAMYQNSTTATKSTPSNTFKRHIIIFIYSVNRNNKHLYNLYAIRLTKNMNYLQTMIIS